MKAETLAFDAEAILAYFAGEPGAEKARDALRPVAQGDALGYLNEVNAAEVWYVLKRHVGADVADDHLAWLEHEAGLRFVSSKETWRRAAMIKADHRMSLGDAFAMATAYIQGCAVLTGRDREFDAGDRLGIPVRRIRDA